MCCDTRNIDQDRSVGRTCPDLVNSIMGHTDQFTVGFLGLLGPILVRLTADIGPVDWRSIPHLKRK